MTIQDIANEAGVSKATVSRYLNKSGYVDERTGRRIEAVVQKHQYKPNLMAKSLKTKKTNNLLVVVPDIGNPFYSAAVKTIQSLAREKDYMVVLYNTNESLEEERAAVRAASEINAAGMLMWSIRVQPELLAELQRQQVPVVLANYCPNPPVDIVHAKGQSSYLTAKHLVELGHRRIAFAGGPPDSTISQNRKRDFFLALSQAGIPAEQSPCFEQGFTEEAGYELGQKILLLKERPTAVCCANDLIALGVVQACMEKGVSVPGEMSVTGIDNIWYPGLFRVRLTTVDINLAESCENMMMLLLDRVEQGYKGPIRDVVVQRRLVIGTSTAPPMA